MIGALELAAPFRFSLFYQELRTLLLPQCFRAVSQRKKRPEGRFASNG